MPQTKPAVFFTITLDIIWYVLTDSDQPRPSIDKEIAHSLLDLSKGNEPKKSSKGAISLETRRLLRQHSAHAAEEGKKEKERKEKEKEEADAKNDGLS